MGVTRNDATRWLGVGTRTIQPSEFMKIAIIMFFAASISSHPEKLKTFFKGLLPYLAILGVTALLLLLEPHMSAAMIILFIGFVLLFCGGAKLSHFIPLGVAGVAGALGLAFTAEYRVKRMLIFLDPWQDPTGDGWQIIQSLYAVGSGGLFGVGLGKSVQKYMYIPEPHNDFIFAILAEELGFIGCMFVIILFGIFVWRGISISMRAPDMFGSLVAIGITAMIGIQAAFSIAVVTSSMPVTGIPLPFFSYGGTALIMLMCCVGILLNISRQATK